jgi:hypothetical protein
VAAVTIQGMKRSSAFTLLGKTCMLAVLLLSACSKKNDPAPEVVVRPACRLTQSVFETGPTKLTSQNEYDSEGRLLKVATYEYGKEHNVVTYEHNEKGQVSKQTTKVYTYDTQANVTVTTRTYTFEYNAKGQVLNYQTVATSTNPSVVQTTFISICEYDSQGNRTKVTTTSESGKASVNVFEYKDGNCTKATIRLGESNEFSNAYEYNLDRENKSRYYSQIYSGIFNASTSRNLVKKSIETGKSDPTYISTTEYSSEYNDKGFPVKTTAITSSNSHSGIFTAIISNEFACQ